MKGPRGVYLTASSKPLLHLSLEIKLSMHLVLAIFTVD